MGMMMCGGFMGMTCANTQTDPMNCGMCGTRCGDGTCVAGACVCNMGAQKCMGMGGFGGQCTNTNTSNFNCGMCGHACMMGQMCMNGTCM
jgi:hypothetical protein